MKAFGLWCGRVWRKFRVARWIVLGLVALLVAARLALPYAVERYVNDQLNHSADYTGRVGEIHIQLWRGRYIITNLKILKRNGAVPVPLFSAGLMYLSLQWDELYHGSMVGEVRMENPRLNFVSGPTAAESQSGENEGWDKMLESLFPFDINRLTLTNGEVHFQNHFSTPPVDIYFSRLSATATNLTNSRQVRGQLPSGVLAHATTVGGGGLDLQLQLDPMAKAPTYQVTAQLTNVDLTALNDFLKAYGKFDVAHGDFAVFASIAAKDGNYDGYLKVFFNKLDIFAWEKERKKNVLQIFWDAIVGTAATVLKNQSRDSLATRIPVSGSYHEQSIGTWRAVATLLRNAFVRALVPKLDERVTIADAQEKAQHTVTPSGPSPPGKGAEELVSTNKP